MLNKIIGLSIACAILPVMALKAYASNAASDYYTFNRTIFYAHNLKDVYPCLPKDVITFCEQRDQTWKDNKVKWYRNTHYVYRPVITVQNPIVGNDGNEMDMTGYAYKLFMNKMQKVDINVRMKEEDRSWKLLAFRYHASFDTK